jgi:DNA invertase Pin-like site-specific DNA recombinase
MTNVVIYARLSVDVTHGSQTATTRQREACRAFAVARDWQVIAEVEDPDTSASNPKVDRPQFEEAVHLVESGFADGILVWKLDRLVRRPAQFEATWQRIESVGGFLASATEPVDTSDAFGLAIVRILVTFAGLEAATIGLRVRAKHRERAIAGQPQTSERPFGLTYGWTAVVPEEAALLREAASRILAGDTVSGVTADWRRRGVPAMKGGQWRPEALRRMLMSPRMVGDREYKGEVVATACFPPLLDELTWARLVDLLGDRSRHATPRSPSAAHRGLVVCGRCGTTCAVLNRWERKDSAYCCPLPPTGCGRISVSVRHVDSYLESRIAARRILMKAARTNASRDDVVAGYRGHAATMKDLTRAYYEEGRLTRREFVAARQAADDLRAERGAMPLNDNPLRRVVVHPSRRGPFSPKRLELLWHRPADGFLDEDLALYFRVPQSEIRSWIDQHLISARRLGHGYFIHQDEVDAFIARSCIGRPRAS